MKSSLRPLLAALAFGLALFPATGIAQNAGQPQNMLNRLNNAVGLSADQAAQAFDIFQKETNALNAIPPAERPEKGMEIRQAAMADIRALLSPVQRKVYDLTPQGQGGGLTLISPENEVARLDAAVGLTASQRADALQIFTEQVEALMDIPQAARMEQGIPIRQATKAKVRALLTVEQQQKYDATPPGQGGGQKVNPVNLGTRLDAVVTLTDEQMMPIAAILMNESADLQPLKPEEQATKGRLIRQTAKAQIRELLTPEQQKKFDANPNGLEDLEQRAAVRNYLLTSPTVAARVGPVKRATMMESTAVSMNDAPISSGNFNFKVEGGNTTETLKIYWQRPTPADPTKIVKLVTSDGVTIQP